MNHPRFQHRNHLQQPQYYNVTVHMPWESSAEASWANNIRPEDIFANVKYGR